jgi:hypothetical protein
MPGLIVRMSLCLVVNYTIFKPPKASIMGMIKGSKANGLSTVRFNLVERHAIEMIEIEINNMNPANSSLVKSDFDRSNRMNYSLI